jgi:hypothetical protein
VQKETEKKLKYKSLGTKFRIGIIYKSPQSDHDFRENLLSDSLNLFYLQGYMNRYIHISLPIFTKFGTVDFHVMPLSNEIRENHLSNSYILFMGVSKFIMALSSVTV